jgi:hypothetical protein
MTDNTAILDGFTREVIASNEQMDLYLLVKPETDFDDCFKAWDMDEQEYVRVNGWLFTVEDNQ